MIMLIEYFVVHAKEQFWGDMVNMNTSLHIFGAFFVFVLVDG